MKWKLTAEPATTWEDYYRFNSESNAGIPQDEWTTRQVDSLIFQARGSGRHGADVARRRVPVRQRRAHSSGDTTLPTGAAGDASDLYGTRSVHGERSSTATIGRRHRPARECTRLVQVV